jgi:membrane-bound lytic murein transglycosylase D
VRDADEEYERFVRDVLPGFELKGGEEADTEEGRQQLDYINQVVSNRSLGITFQGHPMILQFISYYQSRGRSTMSTGLYRSGMFMRMARRIFREEGVPEQVAWLGQVESAWKPLALSWASASGLWQFIPSTGERFGLRRTAYVDERNSFESATRASARYLRWLANRYNGNWELALAAYNSGEGNVDRAISRAGVANFWAAYPYLPRETRNYVPNILATIIIANNPNKYGFGHVRPASPLQWDSVRVPGSTSLAFLAQASDTTVEYLRYLNPELRTSMTPPEPYVVRVPLTKGKDVIAMFKKLPAGRRGEASLASSYSGETWQSISARTGVPVEQLRAANPGMNVPKGRVIVPITGTGNVARTTSQRPAVKAESSKKPESARKEQSVRTVKVRKGDTLTKIASENKVSVSELAKANGISPNTPLQSGKSLKIPAK